MFVVVFVLTTLFFAYFYPPEVEVISCLLAAYLLLENSFPNHHAGMFKKALPERKTVRQSWYLSASSMSGSICEYPPQTRKFVAFPV
jgi:hypothetical protein